MEDKKMENNVPRREWKYEMTPILSPPEVVRLQQVRVVQIHDGDGPLVTISKYPHKPIQVTSIARSEMMQHKIPIIIRRRLPGGQVQEIDARDPTLVFYP